MSFAQQLLRLGLNRIVGAVLGLLISIFSARLLSVAEMGAVAAMVAAIALAARLASLGLGQAAQYFGAREAVDGQRLGGVVLVVAAAISALAAATVLLFGELIYGLLLSGQVSSRMQAGLGLAVPFVLFHFVVSLYFLGLRKLREYFLLSVAPLYASLAVLIAGLLFGRGVDFVIIAWLAQYAAGAAISLYFLLANGAGKSLPGRRAFSPFLAYAAQSFLTSTAAFSVGQVAILSGIRFASAADVGIFTVTQTYANALGLVYGGVGPLIFSHVGSMASVEDQRRFIPRACRIMTVLFLCAAFVIGVLSPLLIPVLFGPRYAEASGIVWFVLSGVVFSSIQKILENYLYGRGRQAWLMFVHLGTAVCIVTLSWWLASLHGVTGLAMATSLGFFFSLIATVALVVAIDRIPISSLLLIGREDIVLLRGVGRRLLRR